ncbi:MAG TPA: NAD(P)/FAD-dependent oxidoreductase [Tessaracoccus flavescens]|uniref:NAD(P)/FAD-dependent oxidoreductase n=1 Tax=Tessaracoccus flavescens TaxID=399497 RepID=A0A921EMB9_9ACTN|nr:NAD(P)/FAD-dependent oxidoreductase [Tessaracoccus flavescens]
MRRLIILGGGTAGTLVANKLRRAYPQSELHLTLIDVDDAHHYQPGYLFLPFGQLTSEQVVKPRRSFIPDGVTVELGGAERIDSAAKQVHLNDGRALPYDTLIIATGVQPRPEATDGGDGPEVGRSVHHFYTLEGAESLTKAIEGFDGGRLVIHITDMPIKCPVAPLEFTFLADSYFRDKRMRRKVDITYVTPLDGAFTKPVASRELADALSSRKIALETDFAIERIDNDAKEIVSYDDRHIPFDLLVTVPLNMGADIIARSGLGDDLNLVPCDQGTMQSLADPDIFVLGDAGTLQTSKAGSVAHFAVDIFMENFPSYLAGKPLPHKFDGHANCFIESGGGKGMLLDFNYKTQPYTGTFPLPVVGPMSLLKETRLNHWAKLAFRWVYWNMLIVGRPLPFTTNMSLVGKNVEADAPSSPPHSGRPTAKPGARRTKKKIKGPVDLLVDVLTTRPKRR